MATNVNITEPPEFLKSYYKALAERGMNMGNLGFTPYDQDRVAPWNDQQEAASQMIQQRALTGSSDIGTARNYYNNLMGGSAAVANVAAPGTLTNINNDYLGQVTQGISTPDKLGQITAQTGPSSIASGGTATAGRNAYLGMNNPFLNNAISAAQDDVMSRLGSQFNKNAFGSTAHQQLSAKELGKVSNSMRMQDYAAQMGLSESDVARQLQTQQYNIGNQNQLNQFNAGLQQQNANTQNQIAQANMGYQGQNIQNAMTGQQFNANLSAQDLARNASIAASQGQFNAGLQGQNIQNTMNVNQQNAAIQAANRAAQMQGLNFAPTLAQQDYLDANAMMGLGNQLQGTNQNIADANYQEFLRQQNYPAQQLSHMQAGLNPSASAFKNSTSTGPDTTQSGNTAANVIGLGLTGYGLYNGVMGS